MIVNKITPASTNSLGQSRTTTCTLYVLHPFLLTYHEPYASRAWSDCRNVLLQWRFLMLSLRVGKVGVPISLHSIMARYNRMQANWTKQIGLMLSGTPRCAPFQSI